MGTKQEHSLQAQAVELCVKGSLTIPTTNLTRRKFKRCSIAVLLERVKLMGAESIRVRIRQLASLSDSGVLCMQLC